MIHYGIGCGIPAQRVVPFADRHLGGDEDDVSSNTVFKQV